MRVRRALVAMAGAVVVASGLGMVVASPASAADTDQIWYQAVGRPSKDAPCLESDPADLAKGWTPWVKSYEMWPNDGTGGWTCGRSILWAKGAPPPAQRAYPSAGCVPVFSGQWIDFGGGWFVEYMSFHLYTDPTCSGTAEQVVAAVYAPPPFEAAALCVEGSGGTLPTPYALLNDAYRCDL
jgi:hypothetical protein